MRITISRLLLETIAAAARADPAREICGLLFGTSDAIESWRQTANVSLDTGTRFEIDPGDLFAAQRAERAGGPRRIGHAHSHPSGDVSPSAHDAAMADEQGQIWLIVSGSDHACWVATRGGSHRGRFDPVAIDLVPPLASPDSLGQSGTH